MRPHSRLDRLLRSLFAASALALLAPVSATAAQILVASSADALSGGDGCSLREAIINANTDSKSGSLECTRGSADEVDVIVLPPETIFINSAIEITDDVTILGGSGSWTILDARYRSRIIDVHPGVSLTIRGVELLRGYADDEGAAIRVQSNGTLNTEYMVATFSKVSAVDGRGAGISLAEGAIGNISRTEVSSNEALGANGVGAGIYCAVGCTLNISNSTITSNRAGSVGGGLWVAGDAKLEFATVAMNKAPVAAGAMMGGGLEVFASIFADNGDGGVGADIDCSGDTDFDRTSSTFIEMPGPDCGVRSSSVVSRSELPAGTQAGVLNDLLTSSYEGAPSKIHHIYAGFNTYLTARIPSSNALCAGLLDQHGRKRVTGAACDLGAFQTPMVSIWKMGMSIYAHEAGKSVYVHLGDPPAVATRMRVTPVSGVGENCSGFETFVDFAPGQTLTELFIDPSAVFALPGLNRASRVCELKAEIVSGSFVGATAGNIRVKVIGNPVSTTRLSTPEPGYYLDFTAVPVGTGGLRSLVMTPDLSITGPFSITRVTFGGNDRSRFEVVGPAATETAPGSGIYVFDTPLVVVDRSLGGSAVQVRCKPGALGDFDAEMVVTTDSPVYRDLVYGVRCSEAHFLSFTTIGSRFEEKDGPKVRAVATLDSPCLLDADGFDNDDNDGTCLELGLEEAAGTATSGVDYESFGGPVVFAPGETQKVVELRIIDDSIVEEQETFGVRITPPTNVSNLVLQSDRLVWVQIDEDDQPSREIKAILIDLPSTADPGETLPFVVAVHNRGSSELRGVRVEVAVGQPMWIRSFALNGASCTLSATKRRASCQLSDVLAANLKPLTAAGGGELTIEDDEADLSRRDDADWVRVYGTLVTADMSRPPTMDIRGTVSVSARAGEPAEEGAVARTVMIDAPPFSAFGGAPGLHWILLLLLPFRRQWQAAIGRKAGGAGSRMSC